MPNDVTVQLTPFIIRDNVSNCILSYWLQKKKKVRKNLTLELTQLSVKERLLIEKNHFIIYAICF